MLAREMDEVLVEIERRDDRRRIGGVADHNGDRLRDRVDDRALERMEELRVRIGGNRADRAPGHQEAESVDRIGRVRHDDDVAGRGDRLSDVGKPLFGAERRHDLALVVELHAEPARVIPGLSAAEPRNALGSGIAVGARLAGGLDELVDDVLRRRQIRVSHAEINDVGTGVAGLRFEAVDLFEDVGRQAPHAVELGLHLKAPWLASGCANASPPGSS